MVEGRVESSRGLVPVGHYSFFPSVVPSPIFETLYDLLQCSWSHTLLHTRNHFLSLFPKGRSFRNPCSNIPSTQSSIGSIRIGSSASTRPALRPNYQPAFQSLPSGKLGHIRSTSHSEDQQLKRATIGAYISATTHTPLHKTKATSTSWPACATLRFGSAFLSQCTWTKRRAKSN